MVNRVGPMLRAWRVRRRLSQLDLALEAGVSARHVSFVETGRARPSAEMVLQLAEHLEVPVRERNQLLLAAGHAPRYGELDLAAPELAPVKAALDIVLAGAEPFPAVVVDRQWELVAANRGIDLLLEGVDPALLEPPVNCMRLALHPDGLAPRVRNHGEWRAHLLERLGRELRSTGDPALATLRDELAAYPAPEFVIDPDAPSGDIVVPFELTTLDGEELSFFSTVAVFGTAVDITVAELSIESFFAADARTAEVVRRRAGVAAAPPR
jgi:transcriptional regulator with XRE-family HTH domain